MRGPASMDRRGGESGRAPAIDVVRDEHGVPHVRGTTDVDLYRGLGFCHARDRGLQMLLGRILGQGRASELLESSAEMLALDTFFRRLHPAAGAGAEIERLGAQARVLLDAYCDGANRAFDGRAPWELRLLGYRLEPWRSEDSILLSRLMGYVNLAQSQAEMERLLLEMVQAGVPPGHLAELFPTVPADADWELLRRIELGGRLVPEALRWAAALPRALASNNWALSGRRTRSGRAMLASDPHLEVNRLPAVWSEIVLERGERYCMAATIPGIPGVAIGRTNDLAWGPTYSFMDAVDSWMEDCRDGCYRRLVGGVDRWLPFEVRTETVTRKGKDEVLLRFFENEHGVLDGDPTVPGLYLTTRWASGTGTGAGSLEALAGLLQAPDVEAGMALLGAVETAWNFVLADRHGGIGYQMSGRMPRRRPGWNGLLPAAGWDPENDWQGFVPAAELPRTVDPASGFVVTANDDLNHLGRARPINLPMGSYRAERIAALLATRDDWDVASVAALQLDVVSPQAECFMAVLRPLLPDTRHGAILRDWDHRYEPASRGACLFECFYRALVRDVFGRVCGTTVVDFIQGETAIVADFYANFDAVLLRAESVWYGDEGRDAAFRRIAAEALVGPLETWGERQRVHIRHLLLGGRVPSWVGFDGGPIALPGGRATIRQGQVYRSGGRETTFAPSVRLVTDFAEPAAHTSLAGGPSDRRFSRWYRSGLDAWLAGRLKTLRPRQPD